MGPAYPLHHTCPFCGAAHDNASPLDAHEGWPAAGDVSLCVTCGKFGVYVATPELHLDKPDETVQQEIAEHPECVRALAAWAIVKAKRGSR